jgi:peptidoglycan/LPS O-acetylase OafA/YrhL
MSDTRGRIRSFDGLRALAILVVFVNHATVLAPGGGVGVQIFFALSGYLITSILVREYAKLGRIRLGRFYFRRLLRLYPALIVATLVATGVSAIAGLPHIFTDAAAAVTYTSNFALQLWGIEMNAPLVITWSLAVEEQFYVVWPIVLLAVLAMPKRMRAIALVLLVSGAAVATLASHFAFGGIVTYVLPYAQVPALLAGCAVALFKEAVPTSRLFGSLPAWGAAAVLVAGTQLLPHGSIRLSLGGYLIVAFASAIVIGHLARGASTMSRILSIAPLVWLGERSYAFYLIHTTALLAGDLLPVPGALQALIALALSVGFAAISWVAIERPFLRLKDRSDDRRVATDVSVQS